MSSPSSRLRRFLSFYFFAWILSALRNLTCFPLALSKPELHIFFLPIWLLVVISATWNISRHISLKNGFHEFFWISDITLFLSNIHPCVSLCMGLCHDTAMARGRRIKLGLPFFRAIRRANETRVFVFLSNARVYVLSRVCNRFADLHHCQKTLCQYWKGHTLCLWGSRGECFFLLFA